MHPRWLAPVLACAACNAVFGLDDTRLAPDGGPPIDAPPACGDGHRDEGEVCDDGNTDDGDGCDATCASAQCLVPVSHATLADAMIDLSCPTVYVYSGTYAERIAIDRVVTVVAVGGEPVILDGQAGGTVVTVGSASSVTLRGFTIRNGRAAAGAGILNRGALQLEAMTIRDNVAVGLQASGGGIHHEGASLILAAATVVSNNRVILGSSSNLAGPTPVTMRGAGIYAGGGLVRVLNGSRIESNRLDVAGLPDVDATGAGLFAVVAVVELDGAAAVRGNVIDVDGGVGAATARGAGVFVNGGIFAVRGGSVIENNQARARSLDAVRNGAFAAGGGFLSFGTEVSFDHALLRNNLAIATGALDATAIAGGGSVYQGSVAVTATAITGNAVRADGVGAAVRGVSATVGGFEIHNASGTLTDAVLSNNSVTATSETPANGGTASNGGLLIQTFGVSTAVVITRCTIDGNQVIANQGAAATGGVAVHQDTSTEQVVLDVQLIESTVSRNLARGPLAALAGGVLVSASTGVTTVVMRIVNSTISGNLAEASAGTASAGGLYAGASTGFAQVYVDLASTTLTDNRATGATSSGGGIVIRTSGIVTAGATLVSRNSIVADNLAAADPDCEADFAELASLGYNLFGNFGPACPLSGDVATNRTGAANLAPLGANGGPTQTHAVPLGSPALEGGDPLGCLDAVNAPLTHDQRGMPRMSGGRCDIGAYER